MTTRRKLDMVSGWTTDQVAKQLQLKPRTVHDLAQHGKLHPQKYLRPGTGGAMNLFDPEEVEEYRQQRIAAKTEIVPANDPGPLVNARPGLAKLANFANLAMGPVPMDKKRYLTLDEAVAYTGLGEFYIASHCESWPIGPHGKRVYRRSDLDKL